MTEEKKKNTKQKKPSKTKLKNPAQHLTQEAAVTYVPSFSVSHPLTLSHRVRVKGLR